MKKWMALCLVLCMCITMAACDSEETAVYVQSVEAVMMVCKMAGVELSLQMKLRLLSAVDFCGGSGVDSELPLQGARV